MDGVRNRKNELTYLDKTPYDEKVANIISDYYAFVKALLELANVKGATKEEIDSILEKPSKVVTVLEYAENIAIFLIRGLIYLK